MSRSSVPPAVTPFILMTVFSFLMAETLLATAQEELRMRYGTHRFVSLPLPMTERLIDANMLRRSNSQAPRAFV
jgi:hypothetical protein